MPRVTHSTWTVGVHPFIPERIPDFVSFTMKYPCTIADVIREIAKRLKLRVENLPREWESTQFPGLLMSEWGGARNEDGTWLLQVHGVASEKLKSLAGFIPHLEYGIVRRALRFRMRSVLNGFDEVAGRLMYEAPRVKKRIPDADIRRIMAKLDEAGYKPIDELIGRWRMALSKWHKLFPKDASYRSFSAAYDSRSVDGQLQFRRGIQQLLDGAQRQYKKAYRIP
jgi:hypothetical protein